MPIVVMTTTFTQFLEKVEERRKILLLLACGD